ncbi:BPSL0761 family protein [Paraburkholderia domus]|uniref:BPSL0761 family protein n=1 Tax=Paraburkholderia domus TaxID=2793075 RepID=UPI002AA590D8|nr:BPSL0761 family protein [Paraburkholderia domus]
MTTPQERTQAVVETRRFLQMLVAADEVTTLSSLQTIATGLLRHYPLQVDIDISSSALLSVLAHPKRE